MSELLQHAIRAIEQSDFAWCRYITANDTGATGAHQAGFYIPKSAAPMFFATLGTKGQNLDQSISITWQDSFCTDSRIKYYGTGSRNEYRLTRFGRDFPFLTDDNTGNLLILARMAKGEFQAYVLSHDDDIDTFFATFNLSPGQSNLLIKAPHLTHNFLESSLDMFVASCPDFPDTISMAKAAREHFNAAHNIRLTDISSQPDNILINWVNTEYSLFRKIEEKIYQHILTTPFDSIESFIKTSNEILNRRKSRAGKSLEHHLSEIFTYSDLIFEEQAITEDNKRPDFLFPNALCYHNFQFPSEYLTVLGAKTTCKDRWRQVLTEADRLDDKYLFTLQQGISRNQLREMRDASLTLVVPKPYVASFPAEYRDSILTLSHFISIVKDKQEKIPKTFSI